MVRLLFSSFFLLLIFSFSKGDQGCLNIGGQCLDWRYYYCTAGYETGLCDGDTNRRCCLPCDQQCLDQEAEWAQSDGSCDGKCMMNSNYCDGVYLGGRCGGPSERQCCADAGCPRIVSRSEWGARPPTSISNMAGTPAWAIVHHTVSPSCSTQSECSSLVRNFQDQHMDVNGWSDIGYSFLVGGDGNVYEGRGWDRVGAHTPGYNSNGLGISVIGNFMTSLPNQQALDALNNLIACGVASGELQQNYGLIGHRQAVSTECPGDRLYQYVQTMPHWQNI